MDRIASTARRILPTLAIALAGCSVLPHAASPTDPRAVYAWPLPQCPSLAADSPAAPRLLLPNLGRLFAGDLAQGFTGAIGSALKSAADADKTGYAVAGSNARYFYTATHDGARQQARPPGCYVVAYTRIAANATSWCTDGAFARQLPASCRGRGRDLLNGLRAEQPLPAATDQSATAADTETGNGLALPDLYAEVALEESGLSGIARPHLAALFYPHALLDPLSSKPRTLAIGITPASFDDKWKPAAIALYLPGIVPGDGAADSLRGGQSGWTYAPPLPASIDPAGLDDGAPLYPATVVATLREVGQPSRFLAAFASAFNADQADYSRAITDAAVPDPPPSRARDAATAQGKKADALKALADYYGACATRVGGSGGYLSAQQKAADLDQLQAALVATRLEANNAASVAGLIAPFADAEHIPMCP